MNLFCSDTFIRSLTSLVGLHQSLVDVLVGDVGVAVRVLPLVQLLFDGTQGIVDSRRRGVRLIRRSLRLVDLLTHVCSSQREKRRMKTRNMTDVL